MQPIFKAVNARIPGISNLISFDIPHLCKAVVYGPQKLAVLNAVAGKVLTYDHSISFPAFGSELWPSQAVHFMNFNQSSSSKAPFIGARYESFRDEFDISLKSFLQSKAPQNTPDNEIQKIAEELRLKPLLDNWFVGLSNGQSRRAQLAVALLRKPRLLVMDEPFLGLDPSSRNLFDEIIQSLPIPVLVGLKGGDPTPRWADKVLFATDKQVSEGSAAMELVRKQAKDILATPKRERNWKRPSSSDPTVVPAIELRNLTLSYKNATKPLFNNLNWTVHEGERVHIRGPNGSGKSTLVALLTADHPQSWNNDVRLFGETRTVGKHSYFGINRDIGHTSPEIHAIFPRHFNTRRAISSAFSFFTHDPPKQLTAAQESHMMEVCEKLNIDLDSPVKFGELPLSQQKLVLFARAIVKTPRLLILDEAFSTLNGEQLQRAFDLLDSYTGTVLVIAHVDSEVPVCDSELTLTN